MNPDVIDFLRESNNIEDEWDDDSLAQAIFAWNYIADKKEITPTVVLKTHKILMLHHLVGNKKGYFRQQPVWIGGKEGKPWYVIPELVQNWCRDVNTHIAAKASPIVVQEDHVQYEAIHPFVDGNGRTGRIFYNWERLQCGLPIDIIREATKQKYYDWFR